MVSSLISAPDIADVASVAFKPFGRDVVGLAFFVLALSACSDESGPDSDVGGGQASTQSGGAAGTNGEVASGGYELSSTGAAYSAGTSGGVQTQIANGGGGESVNPGGGTNFVGGAANQNTLGFAGSVAVTSAAGTIGGGSSVVTSGGAFGGTTVTDQAGSAGTIGGTSAVRTQAHWLAYVQSPSSDAYSQVFVADLTREGFPVTAVSEALARRTTLAINWSPSGDHLAYTSLMQDPAVGGLVQLYDVYLGGTTPKRALVDGNLSQYGYDVQPWSVDGQLLVYVRTSAFGTPYSRELCYSAMRDGDPSVPSCVSTSSQQGIESAYFPFSDSLSVVNGQKLERFRRSSRDIIESVPYVEVHISEQPCSPASTPDEVLAIPKEGGFDFLYVAEAQGCVVPISSDAGDGIERRASPDLSVVVEPAYDTPNDRHSLLFYLAPDIAAGRAFATVDEAPAGVGSTIPYQWSPDGRWFLTVNYYDHRAMLIRVDPVTRTATPYTIAGDYVASPYPYDANFSRNGEWLLFSSNDAAWLTHLDHDVPGEAQRMVPGADSESAFTMVNYTLSPDGKHVFALGRTDAITASDSLFVASISNGIIGKFVTIPMPYASDYSLIGYRWSWDSRFLIQEVTSNVSHNAIAGLYVYELATGKNQLITTPLSDPTVTHTVDYWQLSP